MVLHSACGRAAHEALQRSTATLAGIRAALQTHLERGPDGVSSEPLCGPVALRQRNDSYRCRLRRCAV
jgi:hypothetical protein